MKMKIWWFSIYLLLSTYSFAQAPPQPTTTLTPRVLTRTLGSESVTTLHLRPGYVSSIRLPEEVSSVVIGDQRSFVAEHSEAEPRLVFIKPVNGKASDTNVLITTKAGHEIPLHLISDGGPQGGEVDFFLDYERPRSVLVPPSVTSFLVGETRALDAESAAPPAPRIEIGRTIQTELVKQTKLGTPKWQGRQLRVAVGDVTKSGLQTIVAFSVLNNSDTAIELLPPQVQLSGTTRSHDGKTKAELIPIDDYSLTSRRLDPGTRADGVLVFERPTFKESSEQLFLDVAQAAEVDRPTLVPFSFTASAEGGTR